jgi:hypothetical protein
MEHMNSENEESTTSSKRKYNSDKRRAKIDDLVTAAKSFQFSYTRVPIDLNKDIDELKKLTQDACLRPDLFLDADSTCDLCNLYTNCACKIRNLSKKKRK